MVRFVAAVKITRSDQIADGIVTKPKLSFTAADVAIQNSFMDAQKIYAPDKSQLLLFRNSGLTQGASILTYGEVGDFYAVGNGYYDGVNWQRFNTVYPLWLLELNVGSDVLRMFRAAAGANPASPTEIFRIRNDGRITVPEVGMVFHSGAGFTQATGSTYTIAYRRDAAGNVEAGYVILPRDGEFYNFRVVITGNTANAAVTFAAYIGGDNTTIAVSVPASTTGTFTSTATKTASKGTTLRWYCDASAVTAGNPTVDDSGLSIAFR